MADWQHTTQRLAEVEARMSAVLDELGLTRLATSIPGLSAVGAAAILAPRPATRGGSPPRAPDQTRWTRTPRKAIRSLRTTSSIRANGLSSRGTPARK
jgi:hypothetical protein